MLDLLRRVIKADIRLHNAKVIDDDMAIIFVVNHFTRVETVLLPHAIHRATGLTPWSLASGNLFFGRLGRFLHSVGTISTKDPDRDRIIIHSLLAGEHPWIIFPEGRMVKDKKLVDHEGEFSIYSDKGRRPPHTGPAVLALRTEYYRQKLACIESHPKLRARAGEVLNRFGLESFEQAKNFRTVIIPINITYFPIRSRPNVIMRLARALSKNLSERTLEELSIEGTVLSENSDIDIQLGAPIAVIDYMNSAEFRAILACSDDDVEKLESNPHSIFSEAARRLMSRYMAEIYNLTTINFDHIFATLIRHQKTNQFTERAYRNRIYLSAQKILADNKHPVHSLLKKNYRSVLFEDPSPKFEDFMTICIKEGILVPKSPYFAKNQLLKRGISDFHSVRMKELTYVIANEIEPLTDVTSVISRYAQAKRKDISRAIRDLFIAEDQAIFQKDYERFFHKKLSKDADTGRPFLLQPRSFKAGVVLIHGYLAAPLEIRALGDHLYERGFAVYGVRLKGHGTSPSDLAKTTWEEWYESVNRGYAIIKSLTDNIILGGFSTGGGLAMLAAARKGTKVHSAFAINPPLELRDYTVNLVPSVVTINNILRWLRRARRKEWEFVKNEPENEHINYTMNPLVGVNELGKCIRTIRESLAEITVPTLIVQGSQDPVVNPDSGKVIFDEIGTHKKELLYLERSHHGIINEQGAVEVYQRVCDFLDRVE